MILRELLSGIAQAPHTLEEVTVRDIVTDSRKVGSGSLFVALPGQHHDGREFALEAQFKGAVAIVSKEGSHPFTRIPWIEVKNVRRALAQLSARLYGYPARRLRIHGITGTNGKTTTAYLLAYLLASTGRRVAFWTTNSVQGAGPAFRPAMTTPDPPELHAFLHRALDLGAQDVVMEVSSHALTLERISGINLASAALTNITPDHLDFHGSFEAYVQAKQAIFDYLGDEGVLAVNMDDRTIQNMTVQTAAKVIRFGIHHPGAISAQHVSLGIEGSSFDLVVDGKNWGALSLSIPGIHNVMNALAAYSIASHWGATPKQAKEVFASFQTVTRRLETRQVAGYTLVSDVAMNRASYDAVMQTIQDWKRPVVVVTAVRGNRGVEVNQDIAEILGAWNKKLHFGPVMVSLSASHVGRLAIDYRVRAEELTALRQKAQEWGLPVEVFVELNDAIKAAIGRLAPHGVLLLLGTFGMDDGMDIATDLLREKGS